MLIYIVRHGETKANVDGYLQGWSDDPLNENGIRLAEITGQNMKGIRFDQCVSSPLSRARETAEIILRESGKQIPVIEDNRIMEMNFGIYERASINDTLVQSFFHDPFHCISFPNGEDIKTVIGRTQSFLKELIKLNNNKTYLIVTHGCALRAMLNHLYDNQRDFWQGHVPYNCSINILEAHDGLVSILKKDMILYPTNQMIDRYNGYIK